MALNTKIEWTEATWNPATGCTQISEGCKNCYAKRLADRLKAMGNRRYQKGFKLTLHNDLIDLPLKWKQSRLIFVNSMSDLFHEGIPLSFIKKVFSMMAEAHWHTFQILTKRSDRLAKISAELNWASNIWMGVTVESENHLKNIEDLKSTSAAIKFISAEPLLSPLSNLHFYLKGVDWVVVGGESGPKCRRMDIEWVRNIRDQCIDQGVSFFFKQWGGARKKKSGRILDGRTWNEMPNYDIKEPLVKVI